MGIIQRHKMIAMARLVTHYDLEIGSQWCQIGLESDLGRQLIHCNRKAV